MFLNEGPAQLPPSRHSPPSRLMVPGSREGFLTDSFDSFRAGAPGFVILHERSLKHKVGLNRLAYQET